MREIIFRGKRVDNGEWVEGNYIRKNRPDIEEPTFWCCLIQDMALSTYEVIPETVGQFTGLNDENGVRIFEGDILKCKSPNDNNEEFITSFTINIISGISFDNSSLRMDLAMYDYFMPDEIEVIGNIHEKK